MYAFLRRAAAPALAALLTACTTNIPKDSASPYYQVAAGSTLQLHRQVEIPPGRTRVFLQHGALTGSFDHYAPNCNLEVDRLDYSQAQFIAAGDYRIRRVQPSTEEVVHSRRTLLASLDLAGNDGDDGNAMIYQGYHLWLDDPAGNLLRLSCRGAYADPMDARPPSIDEMRQALGNIASLVLAD
jgi:hypothetical protein